MKVLKEFGEGLVTILGICAYLVFFSVLVNFAIHSPSAQAPIYTSTELNLRLKPFMELRKGDFHELTRNQTNELNEMTKEWCGLFKCDEKMKKDDLQLYEEFCKDALLSETMVP